jgi:hypothetical protein
MSHLISRTAIIIESGESTSEPFTINGKPPTVLEMSAAWTAAAITFAGSADLASYNFIHDEEGVIVQFPGDSSVRIILPSQYLRDHKAVMVCSGTKAAPVNQADNRTLYLEVWV